MAALVFDADDTLWENNIRFERVVSDFIAWLAHPSLDPVAVRTVLDDIERANTVTHGYGSRSFLRSLHDCFERLRDRPATDAESAQVHALAADLVDHRVDLVPAVSATLAQLGVRHRLYLLTKGDPVEQQRKIDASGLARHFLSTHVVPEKDRATYVRLADELGLDPSDTWMIGNSPRSDIAPARAAGWGAVFIPNEHTWRLEHQELDDDARVLELAQISLLLQHF